MNSRHRAREVALQVLFSYDTQPPKDDQALMHDLQRHFAHFQVPDNLQRFAAELVAGTLKSIQKLDELLEKHAVNWKVSRMPSIDRNLLRMATYELLNFPDIPASVTIDEAIELGKQFGTSDTPSFINGVLDSLKIEKPQA
jgi:N utilization substance protein B